MFFSLTKKKKKNNTIGTYQFNLKECVESKRKRSMSLSDLNNLHFFDVWNTKISS